MKKYILTEDTINFHGITLYRIEALIDFSDIRKGDKGGYIEKEENLSHNGNAWVYDNAKVYGNARISGNAEVYGNARISGNAWVYGNAKIFGNAEVSGNAWVYGNAKIFGNARIYGNAEVYGNAKIFGNAEVYGNARISGNAWVYGNAKIFGNAEVFGNAKIGCIHDYIVLKNNWSSGRHFTYTRSNQMWKVGCFYGTSEELIKKAYQDSEISGKCYEATVRYVEQLEHILKTTDKAK